MATEGENVDPDQVLSRIGIWSREELSDPDKKLYYSTSDLKKQNGKAKCFCCHCEYTEISSLIKHISRHHLRFVHKTKPNHACNRENIRDLPRGIENWTKEELADPNKKLFFKTNQLERVNGWYKCLCCPRQYVDSRQIVTHIVTKHPKFSHLKDLKKSHRFGTKRNNKGKKKQKGVVAKKSNPVGESVCYRPTWTEEDLCDQNKELFYSISDLTKTGGKFLCFRCSYTSSRHAHVIDHISRKHPRFVCQPAPNTKSSTRPPKVQRKKSQPQNVPIECKDSPFYAKRSADPLPQSYKRRPSRSTNPVDYSESRQPLHSSNSETETMDDDREKLSIGGSGGRGDNHLDDEATEFLSHDLDPNELNVTLEPMIDVVHTQNDSQLWRYGNSDNNVEVDVESLDEGAFSTEFPEVVEMDYVERNVDEIHQPSNDSDAHKDALLREYQAENEHLAHSISSLQTSYEREIAKLQEELKEQNMVEMNQLLCPKEEPSMFSISQPSSDRRVLELQTRLDAERNNYDSLVASKDEELENLKSKMEEMQRQWGFESHGAKDREDNLVRRLVIAESELAKTRKVLELKEKAERLKLEEELEEQRIMEVEREAARMLGVLEEKRREKEARFHQIQKIQAELSFIH